MPKTKALTTKKERIEYWILKGAQPSSTVAVLLKKNGFSNMDKYTKVEKHQRKKKGEQAAAPATAPAASATPAAAKEAAPPAAAPAEKPAA